MIKENTVITSTINRMELLLDLNTQLNAIGFCRSFLEKRIKVSTLSNEQAIAYADALEQFAFLELSLSKQIEGMVKDAD